MDDEVVAEQDIRECTRPITPTRTLAAKCPHSTGMSTSATASKTCFGTTLPVSAYISIHVDEDGNLYPGKPDTPMTPPASPKTS